MKRYILPILFAAIPALQAGAQSLNPTVEITNTYKAALPGIEKPKIDMAVPDSLLKFDLDFDYSIFDRPYKGAYSFSPYIMDMKPKPDAYKAKKFYLRAGAGYSLHPVFDLVYSPEFKKPFNLNIYGFHKSYIGSYRNISAARKGSDDGPIRLVSDKEESFGGMEYGSTHNGYGMLTKTGISGGREWDKAGLSFDLGYYGIHSKDTLARTSLNMFSGKVSMHSKSKSDNYFYYDACAGIRSGSENLDIVGTGAQKLLLNEFEFDGTFGPVIGGSSKILVDAYILGLMYNSLFDSRVGIVAITPHYRYDSDRWRMSLGVKLSTRSRTDDIFEGFRLNDNKSQLVYPDARIGYEAVRNRLNLYAVVTGGDNANSYISQKRMNCFLNPYFGRKIGPFADNSVERINFRVGAEGNIAEKFRFNVNTGYAGYDNGRIEAVLYSGLESGVPRGNSAAVLFKDFKLAYAELQAVWDSDPLVVDCSLTYRNSDIFSNKLVGFEPARFSGNISGRYNWNNRIFAGVCIDFASMRRGYIGPAFEVSGDAVEASVPGFADLGLSAEYKFNKKFSVWLAGGNLLNMTIQRIPLYPDSGISLNAGICLNL